MSQSAEGYIGVPPNVTGGSKVRQLSFLIAQADGTMQTVLVEVVAICDPDTGNSVSLMTKSQGDKIIGLLKDILKELRK